jgi:hypothetical protein
VENKKIDVLFGLVVIAFLVVTIILIKDFKSQRVNDFNDYRMTLTNIVKQKNDRIKMLSNQLMAQRKENQDLKNTLAQTRNDLDSISKKLAQPVVPAPASAPALAAK